MKVYPFIQPVKCKLGLMILQIHRFRLNTFAKLTGCIKKKLVKLAPHGYTRGKDYSSDEQKDNVTSLAVHMIFVAKVIFMLMIPHKHQPRAVTIFLTPRPSTKASAKFRHSRSLSLFPCNPLACARKYHASGTSHPPPRVKSDNSPAARSILSLEGDCDCRDASSPLA